MGGSLNAQRLSSFLSQSIFFTIKFANVDLIPENHSGLRNYAMREDHCVDFSSSNVRMLPLCAKTLEASAAEMVFGRCLRLQRDCQVLGHI